MTQCLGFGLIRRNVPQHAGPLAPRPFFGLGGVGGAANGCLDAAETTSRAMLDTLDMDTPISRTQNASRLYFGSYEPFHVEFGCWP